MIDFECLNLDTIGIEPIEKDNLIHWQKSANLSRLAYERWKKSDNKKVQIDGIKFKLVPVFGKSKH